MQGNRSLIGFSAGALACVVLVIVAQPRPAAADVTFIEELKVKQADGAADTKRTVYLSGLKEREDSVTDFSASLANRIGTRRRETSTITRFDAGLARTLDRASRTYSEEPLDAVAQEIRQEAVRIDSVGMTAEAPDASPRVTITPSSDTKEIGPWKVHRTTIEVSTEVIDLPSGEKRNGAIVWDLWLADSLPGATEMRSFGQIRGEKLGLTAEFEPLEAVCASFPKSAKEAMLALKEVHGYPVEWSWVVRTALSPEQRAALEESAATQRESLDQPDAADLPDNAPMEGLKPTDPATVRMNGNEDLYQPKGPPPGTVEGTSADINFYSGEGTTVLMSIKSTLKGLTTTSCDPSLFEIPSGFGRTP